MSDERIAPVPDGLDGERLDTAISRMFGISRSAAADVIAAGDVEVDLAHPAKSHRVSAGALLSVTLPAPPAAPTIEPQHVDGLEIIYDDDDVVVVNKPAIVAAHPSQGWTGPSVVGGLAEAGYRISTSGAHERQGIVHRLDVGTSGLMVVAKSERAYTMLKRAFRNREVAKTYHAVVQGHPDPTSGTVDAPIGRHPGSDWKFAVKAGGKESITHYDMIEAFPAASLLSIKLETGRTHQIRVHFSALRHPCVGDPLYGSDPRLAKKLNLERQWLHAQKLGFEHPSSGEWVDFTCDYPVDLQEALGVLRSI